jgi:hypothetical protein
MLAGESSETATAKATSKTAAVKPPAKAATVEATAAEPASMAAATTSAARVNLGWGQQANTGNQTRCHEKTLCSF